MTLGERIWQLRDDRHWSQEYLAKRAQLSAPLISNTENNKTSPNYDTLRLLAKAFKITLQELFEGVDSFR